MVTGLATESFSLRSAKIGGISRVSASPSSSSALAPVPRAAAKLESASASSRPAGGIDGSMGLSGDVSAIWSALAFVFAKASCSSASVGASLGSRGAKKLSPSRSRTAASAASLAS